MARLEIRAPVRVHHNLIILQLPLDCQSGREPSIARSSEGTALAHTKPALPPVVTLVYNRAMQRISPRHTFTAFAFAVSLAASLAGRSAGPKWFGLDRRWYNGNGIGFDTAGDGSERDPGESQA